MGKYLKFIFVIVFLLVVASGSVGPQKLIIQAAPNYPDGTLIKAANDPNIYVINNGLKVWVRSAEVFNNCGYNWNVIKNVASLDAIPTADLIKKADNPDVYRLEKNFKRKLASIEIFNSYNFDWNKVAVVCPYVADSYSIAPLMKVAGSYNIYRVASDFIRHQYLNMAAFSNDGMQTKDVIEVNQLELNSYARGGELGEDGPTSVILSYPQGGETLVMPQIGQKKTIEVAWSLANISDPANYSVYMYLKKNDATLGKIERFATAANKGVHYWDFPKYLSGGSDSDFISATASNLYVYKIKIELYRSDSSVKVAEDESEIFRIVSSSAAIEPEVPVLASSKSSLVSDTSVVFSWSEVLNVDYYDLQWATNFNFKDSTSAKIAYGSSANSYEQTLLAPAGEQITYWYRVRAFTPGGSSDWSNAVSVTVVGKTETDFAIRVTYPNGEENIEDHLPEEPYKVVEVRWNLQNINNTSEYEVAAYLKKGSAVLGRINSFFTTASDGLFSWDFPHYAAGFDNWPAAEAGDDYKIKLELYQGSKKIAEDESDQYFNISANKQSVKPVITSIAPLIGEQGQTVSLVISGYNFSGANNYSGSGISPVSDRGFQLTNSNQVSDTQINATFSIANDATLGTRDITVTTSKGTSNIVQFSVVSSGSGAQSRDTRRRADLSQIQLALEVYFDANQNYPNNTNNGSVSNLADELVPHYLADIPLDPGDSAALSSYQYFVNDSATQYVLVATMENGTNLLNNDLDSCINAGNPSACDCSDVNKKYCV